VSCSIAIKNDRKYFSWLLQPYVLIVLPRALQGAIDGGRKKTSNARVLY